MLRPRGALLCRPSSVTFAPLSLPPLPPLLLPPLLLPPLLLLLLLLLVLCLMGCLVTVMVAVEVTKLATQSVEAGGLLLARSNLELLLLWMLLALCLGVLQLRDMISSVGYCKDIAACVLQTSDSQICNCGRH
jgi:hypothetical protein